MLNSNTCNHFKVCKRMMTDIWFLLLNNNTWIHLNVCKQMINSKKKFVLGRNTWNHLTMYKRMNSGSFKNASTTVFTNHVFNVCIYIYCSFYLFIFFFCYVNFKLSRFLVNIKNGVFSFIVGRHETPWWSVEVKL